jgi:beta-glucosidase/6-phospho-beta-glucosidase/beta-galactosidase
MMIIKCNSDLWRIILSWPRLIDDRVDKINNKSDLREYMYIRVIEEEKKHGDLIDSAI